MKLKQSKLIKEQSGAVLIEAAYVLPLMMVVALLIIDTVVYATDRLAANNAVNDIYQMVVSQAQRVALVPGATSNFVQCTNHQVVPQAQALQTLMQNTVAAVANRQPNEITVNVTQPPSQILDYIVDVQFTAQTLFLPQDWAQVFPVRNRMYISFDYTC